MVGLKTIFNNLVVRSELLKVRHMGDDFVLAADHLVSDVS